MTDMPESCLMGTPGGPMKAPGGGGAGGLGRGGLVGRVGLVGLGGPTGLAVVGLGLGLEVVGHLSQYHRFLHFFLQVLILLGLHSVVGTFPQDVL